MAHHSKFPLFALLAFICAAVSGCTPPPVYLPTSPQVPLLTKQGEFRAALATNASGGLFTTSVGFFSLEAAYAVTDKMGLIANVSYSSPSPDSAYVSLQ